MSGIIVAREDLDERHQHGNHHDDGSNELHEDSPRSSC